MLQTTMNVQASAASSNIRSEITRDLMENYAFTFTIKPERWSYQGKREFNDSLASNFYETVQLFM